MIVVADIGGTHIRVAAGDAPDRLSEPLILSTPEKYEDGIEMLLEAVSKAANGTLDALSIGIAGVHSLDRTELLRSPNLPDWEKRTLAADLRSALSVPVYVENDVALGGLGEALYGAGKGAGVMAYVSVGTGVGGARIVDGRMDRTTLGFEMGHQYLSLGGEPNTLEELVSGGAFEKRYGKPAAQITDAAVWEEAEGVFARGLYNAILHWSPEVVVLGGAMFRDVGLNVERVAEKLHDINQILPQLPILRKALLPGRHGLMGALAYARFREESGA